MITPQRRDRNLQIILDTGIIAVIRAQSSEQLVDVAKALREGGVKAIEVTMTTPNALEVIRQVSALMKEDCVIGVGTVLDPETARAAILAGAEFVVAPTLNRNTIQMCRRYSALAFPEHTRPPKS